MRRALLLIIGFSSISSAFLGDWKIWTSNNNARNSVQRGNSILTATSAGIQDWDPIRGTGRIHTTLQGLPGVDFAGLVASTGGDTIWAVSVDGHLSVLLPGSAFWEQAGSYFNSKWPFTPGCALYNKGILVLGGPSGLTFFRASDRVAIDNVPSFKGVHDTVKAVAVDHDTIWVQLGSGVLRSNPDNAGWAGIGQVGHYLTDPARWEWASRKAGAVIVSDSTGTHADTLATSVWRDASNHLRIHDTMVVWDNNSYPQQRFEWPGGSVSIPDAKSAIATPWGFFVSSSSRGLVQVGPDGSTKAIHTESSFPNPIIPLHVGIQKDGTLIAVSEDYPATVWRRSLNGTWSGDTILLTSKSNPVPHSTGFDRNESIGRYRRMLDLDAQGYLNLGFYGVGGGFDRESVPKSWQYWSTPDNPCFVLANSTDPEGGSASISIRSVSGGIYYSQVPTEWTDPNTIAFLPVGGSQWSCFLIPTPVTFYLVRDFFESDKSLWMATRKGLARLELPIPHFTTAPVLLTPRTYGTTASEEGLHRLAGITVDGIPGVLVAGDKVLGVVFPDESGGRDSLVQAEGIDQDYRALAVDSRNQVWAAGSLGLDIFNLAWDSDSTGSVTKPVFQHVRRVTTADGLPENSIFDLALDPASGRAVIATAQTITSWASPYKPLPDRLEKSRVKVWPNPLRLRQHRYLNVDGATASSQFDLFASDGTHVLNLRKERLSNGTFRYEVPDPSKLRPGLYFWSLKDNHSSLRGPLLVGE